MTDRAMGAGLPRQKPSPLALVLVSASDVFGAADRAAHPFLDLILRLWLAQIFFRAAIVNLADWKGTLYLFAHEPPVSWMDPVTVAYLGTAIELIAPLLLALGLATRPAALALLAVTLAMQGTYEQLNAHVFWALLFAWYALMGAGSLSIDRLLSRGSEDIALPFAASLDRLCAAITRYLGPLYLLVVRLALALMLAGTTLAAVIRWSGDPLLLSYQFGSFGEAYGLTVTLGLVLGGIIPALLALGLATRVSAIVGAVLVAGLAVGMSVSELQHIDRGYWLVFLVMTVLRGAGPLALDELVLRGARNALPQFDTTRFEGLPHVVIVGAGFGGLAAALSLHHAPCRVTVVDRRNYHLFQPLLYQVATASLSPADIATPIRSLFRHQPNVRVLMGRVDDVDTERQEVITTEAKRIPYDYLILATGARHSYFDHDEWEEFAPGLKKIDDATDIRRRLLLAFEHAENTDDAAEQERLLTFVIVGGGPTGVELAGAIAELAHHGMHREFRNIDPTRTKVLLLQGAPRILPAFPEKLSAISQRSLAELGVEVRTDARVELVDPEGVIVAGERIPCRTIFWAAGVIASPAATWVDGDMDREGRLKVAPDLSVPGHANIFAVGDTALSAGWRGNPVPGLAPAAKQGGQYAAKVIRARLEGRGPPLPFRYRHTGSLATIGRKSAVADFGWIRLSGVVAWWLWGLVHVFLLIGGRNRTSVAIEWLWAYLTFNRGTRLITGDQN